jgi:transcriptional regulator with XRE-family HTH domain
LIANTNTMRHNTKRGINNIYRMRRNRSLLQKQLALLLGHRSYRMVSQYESGASFPPFETALLLEIALGASLPELFPDIYQECLRKVLNRAKRLPDRARRSIVGRLLHEDLPYGHSRTG